MSKLRLRGSTSGYTEIQASDVAGDNTLTLPTTADGTLVVADTNDEISVSGGNIGGFDVDAGAAANSVNIDASGRLLVGTSSSRQSYIGTSAYQARVQLEEDVAGGIAISRFSENDAPQLLNIQKARGNPSSPSIVNNGDGLSSINFSGFDGTRFLNAARILTEVDGTPSTDDMPGRIIFRTTPSGSASPAEVARINNAGTLLVGATNAPAKAGSGSIVVRNSFFIGGTTNYGDNQVYVGSDTGLTGTTGTAVFTFKSTDASLYRQAYVKLSITAKNGGNPANAIAGEYHFVLHQTNSGVFTINGTSTIFEYTLDRSTDFAFADLGGGECTVTITNPTAITQNPTWKVEIINVHIGLESVVVS